MRFLKRLFFSVAVLCLARLISNFIPHLMGLGVLALFSSAYLKGLI